ADRVFGGNANFRTMTTYQALLAGKLVLKFTIDGEDDSGGTGAGATFGLTSLVRTSAGGGTLATVELSPTVEVVSAFSIAGLFGCILAQEYAIENYAASQVEPGETVYVKTPVSTFWSYVFDEDAYIQISRNQSGIVH